MSLTCMPDFARQKSLRKSTLNGLMKEKFNNTVICSQSLNLKAVTMLRLLKFLNVDT